MSTPKWAEGILVRSFFDSLPLSNGRPQLSTDRHNIDRTVASRPGLVPVRTACEPGALDEDNGSNAFDAEGWRRHSRQQPKVHHPWDIRIGQFTRDFHSRFAPRKVPGLTYLGTIRRGLQLGALAINEQGEYVQANGDMIQRLKRASIERAIQSLSSFDRAELHRLANGGSASGTPQRRRITR